MLTVHFVHRQHSSSVGQAPLYGNTVPTGIQEGGVVRSSRGDYETQDLGEDAFYMNVKH